MVKSKLWVVVDGVIGVSPGISIGGARQKNVLSSQRCFMAMMNIMPTLKINHHQSKIEKWARYDLETQLVILKIFNFLIYIVLIKRNILFLSLIFTIGIIAVEKMVCMVSIDYSMSSHMIWFPAGDSMDSKGSTTRAVIEAFLCSKFYQKKLFIL